MVIDGKHRALVGRILRIVAFAALCLPPLTTTPAFAAGTPGCRLALALALDVSSSVDTREYELQQQGLAAALLSPDVQAILLDNRAGAVALAVYEWSGRNQQALIADWRLMHSQDDVIGLARRIARADRSHADFPTAMGYALGYGAGLLGNSPPCTHQALDVSGDGINNEGFEPQLAYKNFPLGRVVVNGLVIEGSDPDVLRYYQTEIINGPGAFVEVANGYEDFQRAIERKLLREMSLRLVALAGAPR